MFLNIRAVYVIIPIMICVAFGSCHHKEEHKTAPKDNAPIKSESNLPTLLPEEIRQLLDAKKRGDTIDIFGELTIGKLYYDWPHIVQIIDDHNMIVTLYVTISTHAQERTVWITGYPTNGLADDIPFPKEKGPLPLKVIGTKHYESNFGQRTVFLLEWLDLSQLHSLPPSKARGLPGR